MKKIILSILTLTTFGVSAQNYEWAKNLGNTASDFGYSIAVDASGNVYTTGYFRNTVDFDPGIGVSNLTSQGGQAIFISKLDANGDFVWAKSMGGTSYDAGYSIAVDASGNVYTTGYFQSTADFDPGAGVSNLTSQGTADIFISKLDVNGDFVWAKSMGGTSADRAYSIAVDASGNVYTTGVFQNTVDFDPGAGVSNFTSQGNQDIFISKLDANGNFVWAKSMGGSSPDYGNSIALDASGNVYTTGYFKGSIDFDPGVGVNNLISAGLYDIFISKLDANGDFVWAKNMGGSSVDYGNSIAVDALENVYTTGIYAATADFDPGAGISNFTSQGSVDIFISKLDINGDFVWAKDMGSSTADEGKSLALDASGNIYTTGYYDGTLDFGAGAGVSNLTSQGLLDVFISKLDPNGNFVWAKSMGGSSNDAGYSIAVDASGNTYTTGYFQGTSDYDPDAGVSNLTSQGDYDVFISKLSTPVVLVNSITVQGQGGVSTITTDNGSLQIDATVLPANATNQTYTWSVANSTGSATIDVNGVLTALTNGTVTVTATANDASALTASTSITLSNQTNVGINETNGLLSVVEIYPNPTTGQLNFKANTQINTIKIYNLTGQKVLSFSNTNSININDLTNGIYMAKVFTENGNIVTRKIIKR